MTLKYEPALVSAALQAIIALVVAFGLNLTDGQVAAVLGVAAAVMALLVVKPKVVTKAYLRDSGHAEVVELAEAA